MGRALKLKRPYFIIGKIYSELFLMRYVIKINKMSLCAKNKNFKHDNNNL